MFRLNLSLVQGLGVNSDGLVAVDAGMAGESAADRGVFPASPLLSAGQPFLGLHKKPASLFNRVDKDYDSGH